jgi:hypothetical protein
VVLDRHHWKNRPPLRVPDLPELLEHAPRDIPLTGCRKQSLVHWAKPEENTIIVEMSNMPQSGQGG